VVRKSSSREEVVFYPFFVLMIVCCLRRKKVRLDKRVLFFLFFCSSCVKGFPLTVLFWSFLLTSFLAEIPWNAATIKYRFLFNQVSRCKMLQQKNHTKGTWHTHFFFPLSHKWENAKKTDRFYSSSLRWYRGVLFFAQFWVSHKGMRGAKEPTNARSKRELQQKLVGNKRASAFQKADIFLHSHKAIGRQWSQWLFWGVFGFLSFVVVTVFLGLLCGAWAHTAPTPCFDFPPKLFGRVFFFPSQQLCCDRRGSDQTSPMIY